MNPIIQAVYSRSLIKIKKFDQLQCLLFLYFFTLHADRLGIRLMGFNIRLNNLIMMGLATLLILRLKPTIFTFSRNATRGLFLLLLSVMLSCFLSPFWNRCCFFGLMYLQTVVGYFLLPYYLITAYDEKKVLKVYFTAFWVTGAYAFLQLFFSFFGLIDPFATDRVFGRFARPNAFTYEASFYALYLAPYVAIINLFFLIDKDRRGPLREKLTKRKIALLQLLFLCSTSTSAYFSYFVFLGTTVFLILFTPIKTIFNEAYKKLLNFGFALILYSGLFCVLFSGIASTYFMKFFYQGFMSHHSFFERWVGIHNAWMAFLDRPWVGWGIGGVGKYLHGLWEEGVTRVMMYDYHPHLKDPQNAFKAFDPMNVFTEILGSLGLLGLMAFFILLFSYAKDAWRALFNPLIDRYHKNMIFAFLISMVISAIVLQFNQGLFRTYVWTHFAIVWAYTNKINSRATKKIYDNID